MRDDFPEPVKRLAGSLVGWRCSNPECRAPTSGAGLSGPINVGEAAHIRGASPGGARYDAEQTPEERRAIENAIWLCRICAKKIDADEKRFTVGLLKEWRMDSQDLAHLELGVPLAAPDASVQPVRFALIRIASDACFWRDAWRFRESPVHFGFHQRPNLEWPKDGPPATTLDPVVDITIENDSERALLVHRVGFVPQDWWSAIKGIPFAFTVPVHDSYRLSVASMAADEAQFVDLIDPVHVSAGGPFRYRLHLDGYRALLQGNESVVRFAIETDIGVHRSRLVYLGVY